MGLSSSKVDTYVLRVDESNGKNLLGNHSTGEFVKPKLEKSPTLPTIALKHQKSKVIADDSNALGSYSYGNGAGLGKESKDSKDTRRGSSHGLNSRAMSAKITAVTGPSMAKSGIAISPLVPWLIKSAKFNDCAITDFQLGRIIGSTPLFSAFIFYS